MATSPLCGRCGLLRSQHVHQGNAYRCSDGKHFRARDAKGAASNSFVDVETRVLQHVMSTLLRGGSLDRAFVSANIGAISSLARKAAAMRNAIDRKKEAKNQWGKTRRGRSRGRYQFR